MLPSLAKQVSSAARGTRQWQQRRQPQCHARSAALRYQRSAISLPQPPQPRAPSVIPPPPTPPPPPPPPSFAPICRPFAPPPPSPGGGVVLPQPTSFSISLHARRYDACRCILQVIACLRNICKHYLNEACQGHEESYDQLLCLSKQNKKSCDDKMILK